MPERHGTSSRLFLGPPHGVTHVTEPGIADTLATERVPVEDLTPEDLDRTIERMQLYADLDLGFVDAAVLSIVEQLGALRLATLDRRHSSVMQPRHVDALELVPS